MQPPSFLSRRWAARLSLGLLALVGAALPAMALDCEAGFRPFVHYAGETCIPENPQRIVAGSDQLILLPLLELGVHPVGSAGVVANDGTKTFARVSEYDTTGIEWIGIQAEPDREAIAALEPDLIIAPTRPEGAVELYSAIAPTIVIDMFEQPMEEALLQFADVVNKTEEAKAMQAAIEAKATATREQLGDRLDTTTVSILKFWADRDPASFQIQDESSIMGAILRLLPVVRPEAERGLTNNDDTQRSWEVIESHEADVMFHLHYDNDGRGATDNHAAFKQVPYLQALAVARAGQVYPLDGSTIVGVAWSKIENGLDQMSEVLLAEDIDRDLVTE